MREYYAIEVYNRIFDVFDKKSRAFNSIKNLSFSAKIKVIECIEATIHRIGGIYEDCVFKVHVRINDKKEYLWVNDSYGSALVESKKYLDRLNMEYEIISVTEYNLYERFQVHKARKLTVFECEVLDYMNENNQDIVIDLLNFSFENGVICVDKFLEICQDMSIDHQDLTLEVAKKYISSYFKDLSIIEQFNDTHELDYWMNVKERIKESDDLDEVLELYLRYSAFLGYEMLFPYEAYNMLIDGAFDN